VQSATGEVADAAAIRASAKRHGARTLCDATQAIGWMRVDAGEYDALICHAYKWLCAPRGVAFLTIGEDFAPLIRPIYAGWYAGADPWTCCYGGDAELASDASRFDLSPAWQAFVGAEPALQLFASLDVGQVHAQTTALAARFRAALKIDEPERGSAIVTWADPDGADLARLAAAGITASGRAGRARVAFHVFNDDDDVAHAVQALGR
jgi:selenocysteine lyase/cysteine desulfurase